MTDPIELPQRSIKPNDDPSIFNAIGQLGLLLYRGPATWTFGRHQHELRDAQLIYDGSLKLEWEIEECIPMPLLENITSGSLHFKPFTTTEVTSFSQTHGNLGRITTPAVNVRLLEFFLINCAKIAESVCAIGDWRIEIKPTKADTTLIARFSHCGAVTRRDKGLFDAGSSDDLLDALGWALSFATGRMVFPTLQRGFDAEGTMVWMDYAPKRYSLNYGRELTTWLPKAPNDQLAMLREVITGLHKWLADPVWNEALRLAIDCYCDAVGQRLSEASRLILIQAGLEKLVIVWQGTQKPFLKRNRKPFPKTGDFGERLSLMLEAHAIDRIVPVEYADLASLALTKGMDAAEVVAFVRNRYTHKMTPEITPSHETQARQLSQHYLEQLMLKSLAV